MEFCFFFFKQKTAYEMRISDWSSDVCSSDLYAVEDPNGASDVIDLRLTRATANPPVAGSPIPLVGQSPQGLSPRGLSPQAPPQGGEITPPPADGGDARLLSAPGSAAEGGNFAEVSLPGPAKDQIAREMLNRPIRIT